MTKKTLFSFSLDYENVERKKIHCHPLFGEDVWKWAYSRVAPLVEVEIGSTFS